MMENNGRIEQCSIPDFHSVATISFGELLEDGWVDWTAEDWKFDSYSDEQRARFCKKFEARFFFRELGILPPGRWKREFIRLMNEITPKYKQLFALIDQGANPMAESDRYGKHRTVYSDFPATQLNPDNQDYASNATDIQYEDIELGNFIDAAERLQKRYNDVDVMMLDECERLFSFLMTVNMNGF